MSSVAQSLATPFDRLKILPTMMSWLGTWVADTQYFKNNVVVSPADNAVYILIGASSLIDGTDPSASALWEEVMPTTTTGVATVSGSAFINVDNTDPQNPVVSNTGVLTLTAQNGLQAQGGTKNPLLVNTGVSQVFQGLGINVTGNTISNTGVLGLAEGTGIHIPTGLGFEPTVINTGVVSLVAGLGVVISDLPTARAGEAPFVSITAPQSCRFMNQNDVMTPSSVAFGDFGTIPIPNGSNPNSILFKYINGTPPNADGGFLFDFSGWCFKVGAVGNLGVSPQSVILNFFDSTTNKTISGLFQPSIIVTTLPFYLNLEPIFLSIQAIKAAGLTRITDFVITNNYSPSPTAVTLSVESSADTIATYYPTNLM